MVVVHQNDISAFGVLRDVVKDTVGRRSRPIQGIHVPQDNRIIVPSDQLIHPCIPVALWGAEQLGARIRDALDHPLAGQQFLPQVVIVGLEDAGVRVGVISDLVPSFCHLSCGIRIIYDVDANEEKGSAHAVFIQDIQYLRSKSWVRAVVKGQRDLVLSVLMITVNAQRQRGVAVQAKDRGDKQGADQCNGASDQARVLPVSS